MAKKKSSKKTKTKTKKANKKSSPKKAAKKSAKKTAVKKAVKKVKAAAKGKVKKTVKKAVKKAAKKTTKKASVPAKASVAKSTTPKMPKVQKVEAGPHPWLGKSLPEFEMENQDGTTVSLAEVSTQNPKVVIYFYPKDDTPGCTVEACEFRDHFNRAASNGIKVFGVSPDSAESHKKFAEKFGLNFDLLVDTDHKLADAMGVWKQKNFMGKSYMGIERSTFLLSEGNIVKAWQPVKVEGHVEDVLQSAEKLGS